MYGFLDKHDAIFSIISVVLFLEPSKVYIIYIIFTFSSSAALFPKIWQCVYCFTKVSSYSKNTNKIGDKTLLSSTKITLTYYIIANYNIYVITHIPIIDVTENVFNTFFVSFLNSVFTVKIVKSRKLVLLT